MPENTKSVGHLLENLQERAKELNCMYAVEEALNNKELSVKEILQKLAKILPKGMQYPEICAVKFVYQDITVVSKKFKETTWYISESIFIQDRPEGLIRIYYTVEKPPADEGTFLKEERRVLNAVARRLEQYLMYQKLKLVFDQLDPAKQLISEKRSEEWKVLLELLRRSDPDVYTRMSRKMLNHLVWKGIQEAEEILNEFIPLLRYGHQDILTESNAPIQKRTAKNSTLLSQRIFKLAENHYTDDEMLILIQKWVQQDKTSFLVRAVSNINSSLNDIIEAIRRYDQIMPEGMGLAPSAKIGVSAALIRRFFTDQLDFVIIAKNFVQIHDFFELAKYTICPVGSHGKLGGKSAGLFLAQRIIQENTKNQKIHQNMKVPKTWYLTSDAMIHFMHYNNLEELLEQKYKPIDEIRQEYPHVMQLFKNSHFPPDLVQGISMALDDFGNKPLIVRSSSLLEDRLGSAFSGKYKSLFLANQGKKNACLEALLDAIAEVYASTLGPDPMLYRSERGLIDFHEEMGIMIQEVVGKEFGDYFLPAFAGVAFSNNEFRWSPRIKREDGLIRIVPGLGTRAVDRLSDDYPILIAPGQPGLRANVSIEERTRYSPQKIDVLNLKANRFETLEIKDLLHRVGNEYPFIDKIVSLYEPDHLRKPVGIQTDFEASDCVVTFDGLVSDTPFVKQLFTILKILQNTMATPVDIEFAYDGEQFYLLQCRAQSYSKYDAPSPIPKNVPANRILFSANRFVSNGTVPDIRYIVYIDPENYNQLSDLSDLKAVGRAVGSLNQLLPKRQFILMGPGRWGSRGDIKLGVNVTYSDINNTAVLIEIARKKGNYVPDLSFGTHFFQDLVEASIRYLPLYPDDENVIFNQDFLTNCPNALFELAPSFSFLSDTVRVIEVPGNANGMVLRILMNADIDRALGMLSSPSPVGLTQQVVGEHIDSGNDDHWRWRMDMAEKIAVQLDPKKYGVQAIYLAGSTKNTTAQAGSDIDLIVDFTGTPNQKKALLTWMEGWSLALDEINYQRTGFKAGGLLDVHLVTEIELANPKKLQSKLNINIEGLKRLSLAARSKD